MHLAGHEDYKEICEDARLEDRAHFELIVPRIYELGGELPNDLPAFHDQAGCRAAKLPDPPTAVNILTLLLESERCAIRSWSAVCDMTFGKDPRTYDLAARTTEIGPADDQAGLSEADKSLQVSPAFVLVDPPQS